MYKLRRFISLTLVLAIATILSIGSAHAMSGSSSIVTVLDNDICNEDAMIVIDDVAQVDISPMAIPWPLIGDWIAKAIGWLANSSTQIQHILNKAQHAWAQVGVYTEAHLLNVARHILTTGQAQYITGSTWYYYGYYNSRFVEMHGAIVEGIYRISDMWLK